MPKTLHHCDHAEAFVIFQGGQCPLCKAQAELRDAKATCHEQQLSLAKHQDSAAGEDQ